MSLNLKMQQYVDWKIYNVTKIKDGYGYRIVSYFPIWTVRKYHSKNQVLQLKKLPVQTGIKQWENCMQVLMLYILMLR